MSNDMRGRKGTPLFDFLNAHGMKQTKNCRPSPSNVCCTVYFKVTCLNKIVDEEIFGAIKGSLLENWWYSKSVLRLKPILSDL